MSKFKDEKKQDEKQDSKAEVDEKLEAIENQELKAIAAEFPDFVDVIAGANYDAEGPMVENPDPNMRYYLAQPNAPSSSQGVERVRQLGYQVSEKAHNSPDCVLMETPRKLYDYRMAQQRKTVDRKMESIKSNVSHGEGDLEVLEGRKGVRGQSQGVEVNHPNR